MQIDASFSQFNEDVVIASVLGASGHDYAPYFIDVGANDGKSWSNSWLFGQKGWNLLLVEPIAKFAQHCRDIYAGKPGVIVEEKAIAPVAGMAEFFVTDEPDRDLLQMGSSLSPEGVPFGLRSVKINVETAPLSDLLRKHDVPKNYGVLSVDAEGHDLAVLETAALDLWRPSVVCVEMAYGNPAYAALDQLLTGHGYRYAASTPSNAVYLRTS
ncbi:hypothetical protein ASE85_13580 [Sphingobium sp. Leaf26]|uniref:FkbM family methyltransferase n=1 Tax=Sphingobium sp. Leaf26 TaxID=1735693 RepID=UPI0006F3BBF9|nr:FkbM family methyltransferase [Sphingobium sp. Leaf26]KQM97899.1 hypothetical protein ASE85_13580 [Sphingobium sp. Leaf26]